MKHLNTLKILRKEKIPNRPESNLSELIFESQAEVMLYSASETP